MKITQCEKILDYMERFGSIPPVEAFSDLGVFRLASRIHDLRGQGYDIRAFTRTGKNRFGESVHYKVYRLGNNNEKENNNEH